MISIYKLLNKIKWDKNLNSKEYRLYYFDRITNTLKELKFSDIKNYDSFSLEVEKDNKDIDIPLHRIREVKRKDKVVWKQ